MSTLSHTGQSTSVEQRAAMPSLRRDVQGLRAVAVFAVIADHLAHWPSGGFVGVDVFFVISGYLITGLLLREHDRTGTISFIGFYVRRCKRILPAAVLVLAATVAGGWALLGGQRAAETARDALWSLFFAGNWRFAALGTDYFQEGLPPSPLQHFWSLGVEEQFYVVWPWLMLGVLAFGVKYLHWQHAQRRAALTAIIGAITVASFLWAMHETEADSTTAYFSTFSRAWELGVGALLAILGTAMRPRTSWWRTTLGWAGVAGIGVSVVIMPQSPGFPAPWAALPVLASALVIGVGHGIDQPHLWLLTNRVSRYLGDISYSLYLWHFPVIILLIAILPTNSPLYYAVAAVLVFALSALSFRYVEDPIRRSSWLTGGKSSRTLRRRRRGNSRPTGWRNAGLVAMVGGTVALVTFTLIDAKPPNYALARHTTQPAATTGAKDSHDCNGAAFMNPANKCTTADLTDYVVPAVEQMTKDEQGAFDCWIAEKAPFKTCNYQVGVGKKISVALIGDSHAATLLPGLTSQLGNTNWSLDTYIGWNCEFRSGDHGPCTAWPDIRKRLETGPRYDVVITTAARQMSGTGKAYAAQLFAEAWRPVIARGTKVVVVGDNPLPDAQALQCLSRIGFSPKDNNCGMSRAAALSEVDPLIKAASLAKGARLVDMTAYFCTQTRCPAEIGNVITYRDTVGHMTGTFSRTLGPYLVSSINKAIAQR